MARSGAAAAIGTASVIVGRGTAEEGSGTAEEAIGTMSTGANRQEVEVERPVALYALLAAAVAHLVVLLVVVAVAHLALALQPGVPLEDRS